MTGAFSAIVEYIQFLARRALPYGFMLFLIVFNSVALPVAPLHNTEAPFFLMALYYWSIYRPTLVPPWMAFCAGILVDLFGGAPVGLSACIFVIVQWVVSDQRRYLMGQSFVVIWFGFFMLSIFTGFMEWLLFSLVNFSWAPIKLKLFSLALGVALFPVVCLALHWTHRALPAPERRL